VQVSGPPLTWENTGSTRSDGSSASGKHSFNHKQRLQAAAHVSSGSSKGDLPSLPQSNQTTPKKYDSQGTVRQAGNGNGLSREPSDEYDDDYDDDDIHDGPPPSDDDLPDTTMLDSVVLPAIASVRVVADCLIHSLIPSLF
jgi:serine/threonine-protein kinase 24/25/MST4